MKNAERTSPSADTLEGLQALLDLSVLADWADALLRAQRLQWEAVAAWQRSFAELQKEAFDEWVSRWGGGAPLDA